MNIFSLFEEKELSEVLIKVIKNELPEKALEKTKWYEYLILQSFADKNVKDFINYFWPDIEPRFLLGQTLRIFDKDIQEIKIRDELKNLIIDKKLIETLKQEQKLILFNKELGLPLNGPKPKCKKIKVVSNKTVNCVATLERYQHNIAYEDIYKFLIDLSDVWIKKLENGLPDIDCNNQWSEEKDNEIAEIIFLNFPKTFDICEKPYYLYICSYNWNFTKEKV